MFRVKFLLNDYKKYSEILGQVSHDILASLLYNSAAKIREIMRQILPENLRDFVACVATKAGM